MAMLAQIDGDEGEVTDQLIELEQSLTLKVQAYALVIERLDSEAQAAAACAEWWEQRARARTRGGDSLRRRLAEQLTRMNVDKIKTPTVTASFRETVAVSIITQADAFCALHAGTTYERVKAEPNKTAIKDALEAGESVPFAELKTNRTLQLR